MNIILSDRLTRNVPSAASAASGRADKNGAAGRVGWLWVDTIRRWSGTSATCDRDIARVEAGVARFANPSYDGVVTRSGRLLREARTRAGLSQNELGRRSGVAPTLISAYENGRRTPGGDTLLRLIDASGATLAMTVSVERSRQAAAQLEQVCALAMELPRRARGPLAFPSFRTFAV